MIVADDRREDAAQSHRPDLQRGFIAEWTVTIILLLFGTTSLVQAFVIPTGSMEDTLLIGDHLLVDKLSYAPSGLISRHILPYYDVQRGDIIVFRYPVDIQQTFVKRAIGIPGDHIRLVNKQLILNGKPVIEPEVSSTMSMLALRIWRSMTTSGFTRASAGGAMVQASTAASAAMEHSWILSLGSRTVRTARRATSFTRRDIGGIAGRIEENPLSGSLLCARPATLFTL